MNSVEKDNNSLVSADIIENRIFLIREQKVMFDIDLAILYQVPAKALNQAVKRNIERFPEDFMFQLSIQETKFLRSQFVTLEKDGKPGRGRYSKYRPFVFTEQGIAMLSSVLKSNRAIQVNIAIMRAFVKLRRMVSDHKELAEKLRELEKKLETHDKDISSIFQAIRQIMQAEEGPKKKFGYI